MVNSVHTSHPSKPAKNNNSSDQFNDLASSSPASPSRRESRHVRVGGLPPGVKLERVSQFFAQFGKVQKVEQRYVEGERDVVVSFMDVRSAQKAHALAPDFEGRPLLLEVHEQGMKNAYGGAPVSRPSSAPAPTTDSTAAVPPPQRLSSSHERAASTTFPLGRRPAPLSSIVTTRCGSGLQGVLVKAPHRLSHSIYHQQLSNLVNSCKVRARLIHISIDDAEPSQALVLLQNVSDINALVAEIQQSSLAALPPDQTLSAQVASHVTVTEAHNAYLAATAGALSGPLPPPPAVPNLRKPGFPDPCQKVACRTLYVRSLERKVREEALRDRFCRFGPILEVDIKNRESPAPFAFIQFADIESVANAIYTWEQNRAAGVLGPKGEKLKIKTNWGRSMPASKLWLGALPRSCSSDYLFNKLRNALPQADGVQEVIYDASRNEAIVLMKSVELAQHLYNKIKNRQIVIPPERPHKDHQPTNQQVDYATDKLHDFFVDRKFGRLALSSTFPVQDSPPASSSSTGGAFSWTFPNRLGPTLEPSQAAGPSTVPGVESVNAPEGGAVARPGAAPSPAQSEKKPKRLLERPGEEGLHADVLLAPPPDPPTDLSQAAGHRSPMSRHASPDLVLEEEEKEQRRQGSVRRRHKPKPRKHSTSSVESSDDSISSSASSSPERGRLKHQDAGSEPSTSSVVSDNKPGTPPEPPHTPTFGRRSAKRSDEGLASPPNIRELDSPEGRGHQTVPTTSALLCKQSAKQADERKKDGDSVHNSKSTTQRSTRLTTLTWEPSVPSVSDPRNACAHYVANDERELFFPTFYTEDEAGHRYCRHLLGVNRRPSQPQAVTPGYPGKTSPQRPVSRTISSGSEHVESSESSSSTTASYLQPLPPPPPPVTAAGLSSTADPMSHFSERINALALRVDSIYEKHSSSISPAVQARISGSIEDDLQRLRCRKSQFSSGGSHVTTPNTTPSTPQATDQPGALKMPGKLTINIPSTNSAASSLVSSPALPFPQPPGMLPGMNSANASRSMSFSTESPGSVGLAPRSLSYSFNSPSPSLPLPPPPPQLMSPGAPVQDKLPTKPSPPKTATRPHSPIEMQPAAKISTPSAQQPQTPKTAHVNGFKATPSTSTSATVKLVKPEKKETKNESEEVVDELKKLKDKTKLLQSLQIPKKKDPNQKENMTFVSPLSRLNSQPNSANPPVPVVKPKPVEKQQMKTPASTPSSSKDGRVDKKKDKDKKDKHRSSLGSLKGVEAVHPKTMSSRERHAAFIAQMEKLREKGNKKFTNKKERDEYLKVKEQKLRAKFEQLKQEHEKAKKEKQKKLEEKSKGEQIHKKAGALKEKDKEKIKDKEAEKDKQKAKDKKKLVRQRTPSDESSDDDDSEDNASESYRADFGLKSSEYEAQVILYEAAKNGSLNLSMYERIKRKRTASKPDESKKSEALAKLKEKNEAKKKRRVQVSSDTDDSEQCVKKASDDDSDAATTVTNTSACSSKKTKSVTPKKSIGKEVKPDKKKKLDEPDKEHKKKSKKVKAEPISDDELGMPKTAKKKVDKPKKNQPSVSASESEESDGEAAVKSLRKQFDAYNNSNNDSETDEEKETEKDKEKERRKKMTKKQSATNFNDGDIFAANSDDGDSSAGEGSSSKKSKNKQKVDKRGPLSAAHIGKPGRPKKLKEEENNKTVESKTSKKSRDKDRKKVSGDSALKRSMDEDADEPSKKKVKTESAEGNEKMGTQSAVQISPATQKKHKKEPAAPLVRPVDLPSSMEISPTLFGASSPTPSTGSDNVRLENFVMPSTQLASPNPTHTVDLPLSTSTEPPPPAPEVPDPPKVQLLEVPHTKAERRRSSSSSSATSSSTSGASTASSASRKEANNVPRSPVPPTAPPARFETPTSTPRAGAISLSPSRLLEEINFEDSSPSPAERSNADDDDDEIEAELLRQMAKPTQKPAPEKTETTYCSQNTQETEDAVESISNLMDSTKSEDEEEEGSYQICAPNPPTDVVHEHDTTEGSKTTFDDKSMEVDEPVSQPQTIDGAKDTDGSVESKADGRISPISSVIASVARGDAGVDPAQPASKPSAIPTTSAVLSHISHLPTPPPSRSSDGSPQGVSSQFAGGQTSPKTLHAKSTLPPTSISNGTEHHPAGAVPKSEPCPQVTQIHNAIRRPAEVASPTQVPTSLSQALPPNAQPVLSIENILSLLQMAGISPNNISPHHLTNPQLLLSTLQSSPAASELLQHYLRPQTADIARQLQLQQQQLNHSKPQQFLPFANTMMALLQQDQQRKQMAQLQQQQQQHLTPEQQYAAFVQKQAAGKTMSLPQSMPQLLQPKIETVQPSWFNESRYPICWKGNLAMKSNDTRVQMHLVSGNYNLMERTANELALPEDGVQTIRINQRMRLYNPHLLSKCESKESNFAAVCNKMNDENEFVALICFPCGNDVEQVIQQTSKMTSSFINYFTSKMAAGVVTHTATSANPSCVAHVFPPCDWTEAQLSRLAPDFAKEIDKVQPTYLFVVVTGNEAPHQKPDPNGLPSVPVMSINCGRI